MRFQLSGLKKFLGAGLAFASLVSSFSFSQVEADQSKKIQDRLSQIFYWQIADELKLTPKVEKEMVLIIEDIQRKRELSLKQRDEALEDLKKTAEKKIEGSKVEPILVRYQQALSIVASLDQEEHERLKKLMGIESLAKYYLVREDVTKRIRDALKSAERKPGK